MLAQFPDAYMRHRAPMGFKEHILKLVSTIYMQLLSVYGTWILCLNRFSLTCWPNPQTVRGLRDLMESYSTAQNDRSQFGVFLNRKIMAPNSPYVEGCSCESLQRLWRKNSDHISITVLKLWNLMTRISVRDLFVVIPGCGLLPVRRQATIMTNVDLLPTPTLPPGTSVGEIWIKRWKCPSKELHLKISCAKLLVVYPLRGTQLVTEIWRLTSWILLLGPS